MQTTITSKGQLVVPKPIREVLHLKPGAKLDVTVDGNKIILQAASQPGLSAAAWKPINPKGSKLTTEELAEPVRLKSK